MFAYGIFKVIYAPREAFKEIAQNPKYFGPILVMILFVIANIGSAYILATKTYVEATMPSPSPSTGQRDVWTENKTFWRPLYGAYCDENFTDYISGSYYGNRSIEFRIENNDKIAMELRGIGEVNCSTEGGYTMLYLRVKWTSPNDRPKNVSLYLYSDDSTGFYRNITDKFYNASVNVWNNLTIHLADENWHGHASWENITVLKLEFTWNQTSSIRVLIDGLFFGGVYKPYLESTSTYIASYAAYSFTQFFLRWFLLGGLIYFLTKAFKAKTVWRVTLVLAGFALITMFVQAVISTATFSALPTLKYPLEFMGGVKGEAEAAYNKILDETWLINQIYSVVQMCMLVWTVALCAIAIRLTAEFSWSTSFLTAFIAYFIALFIEGLFMQF